MQGSETTFSTHERPCVHILNGPNLNRLGMREPELYGSVTLEKIHTSCLQKAEELGLSCVFRQSNEEGVLVTWIQEAADRAQGLVMNPAAYTHTSIALHDAVRLARLPYVEVHLSNIYARESFRHHSTTAALALGLLSGFGVQGYIFALEALKNVLLPSV